LETAENGIASLVLEGVRALAPRYPGRSAIDVYRYCATMKFVSHSLPVVWNYSNEDREVVEGGLEKNV